MVLENLVHTIGKAKLADFISNPKGSRQFQQFIKLGTKEHRNSAIEALSKQVPDLAVRNIYALLTLEKIVTYGLKTDESFTTEKFLKPVMSERKVVEQLLFHRLGCKFLNKLYLHPAIKPALKKQMMQIILVPRSIELLGESKEKLRQYYLETAKRCIDKELLGFDVIQRLLKQAVTDFADDKEFNEELLAMSADGLPHLLSSRDGVHVVVKMLGIASAKHKKSFIKELKGKFAEIAKNSVTNVVLIRLFECVDDTVLIGKSVLSELVGSDYSTGKDLMLDVTGRIPFLFVLENLEMKTGRCYNQSDRQLLASCPMPTAMKDKSSRSSEISAKLIPSVLKIVKSDIASFVSSDSGKDVVVALIRALSDDSTQQAALIEAVMEHLVDASEINQSAVTCINSILKEVAFSVRSCWTCLVERITSSSSVDQSSIELAHGPAAFILMNLLRSADESVSQSVRGALRSVRQQLSAESGNKGTEILLQESEEGDVMDWSKTVSTFVRSAPSSKRASSEVAEVVSKKQKTETEEGKASLFDDEEEEDDELWGIVGDDDEYIE